MTTPQQFLESFLREKVAAYAEANVRLAPIYTKYSGEPLLEHAGDFLLPASVREVIENVKQSAASAILITREHFRIADLRMRYHLAAVGDGWWIVRIDRDCFICRDTGRRGRTVCQICGGEGWYDPRRNTG